MPYMCTASVQDLGRGRNQKEEPSRIPRIPASDLVLVSHKSGIWDVQDFLGITMSYSLLITRFLFWPILPIFSAL